MTYRQAAIGALCLWHVAAVAIVYGSPVEAAIVAALFGLIFGERASC